MVGGKTEVGTAFQISVGKPHSRYVQHLAEPRKCCEV